MAAILGILSGMAILIFLFKPFFGSASRFWQCVRFWITPDLFSLFRGEYMADWLAEIRLGLWLFCGGGIGYGVYAGVTRLMS